MDKTFPNAIILISCPDRRGLVLSVTDFIYRNNGNIERSDQHIDVDKRAFFMRVEWSLKGFKIEREKIGLEFAVLARKFNMDWRLYFTDMKPVTAVFVSKELHCLYDLLFRYKAGQLNVKIPLIVSNYPDAGKLAEFFKIDFKRIPTDKKDMLRYETRQLRLLEDYGIDTIVLARYMKVLSKFFVDKFQYKIINIHHSFLPAFRGAKPYEQAYRRGVKIIGATSHYVTEELDAGPIIAQDIVSVSHTDTVAKMREKGADLEKIVLSRAVRLHSERKVLVHGSGSEVKTIVFD